MALDSRIMAMVARAKGNYDRLDLTTSVLSDLAQLGLAKATKNDLRRIVVRAAERDRDAEMRREVIEELDRVA